MSSLKRRDLRKEPALSDDVAWHCGQIGMRRPISRPAGADHQRRAAT